MTCPICGLDDGDQRHTVLSTCVAKLRDVIEEVRRRASIATSCSGPDGDPYFELDQLIFNVEREVEIRSKLLSERQRLIDGLGEARRRLKWFGKSTRELDYLLRNHQIIETRTPVRTGACGDISDRRDRDGEGSSFGRRQARSGRTARRG